MHQEQTNQEQMKCEQVNQEQKSLWQKVKSSLLSKNNGNELLRAWLNPLELKEIGESAHGNPVITISVPSSLHKDRLNSNLLSTIFSEIRAHFGEDSQINVVVDRNRPAASPSEAPLEKTDEKQPFETTLPNYQRAGDLSREALNKDYTFEKFIVGRSNEFAHGASLRVAEDLGQGNNPLFIYGPTGMGKTHLLHAVGNFIKKNHSHRRICYVSAETFLNECIRSMRHNQMEKFRNRYREQYDVLLMDDIQIFEGKEASQEEFFNTLEDCFRKNRQVVVACDRPPRDMKMEDRVTSRLERGLIADIGMAPVELRISILKFKAESQGLKIPNDVIEYIASISTRSIRELEGNLNRVKMFSELQGRKIDLDLAKEMLAGHHREVTLSVGDIIELCAKHFDLTSSKITSKSRQSDLVRARHLAMHFAKKHTDKSLTEIGKAFNGRNHTTVLNALRQVTRKQENDPSFRKTMESLEMRIQRKTGV